ncbi:MAG: hypothetical protein J0J05_12915 [Microbacterium sp.]|uniref:hypothetical protein n=1 Tax=Microbacterium sp. TaxID=51671 RepID=UPI001AD4CC7E|nr:hypothetical protein [Microbacterium sp.]MBN9154876.1 hypothetical protein [Microbacterium sp.]
MNAMPTRAAGIAAGVFLSVCAGLLAAPAGAAEVPELSPAGQQPISSVTHHNQQCERALKGLGREESGRHSAARCTTTVVLSASRPTKVTVEQIQARKSDFASADYASIVVAAAAGAVKSKNYSQTFNNLTDQETQYGKFYYDGSRAWVTSTYRGLKGTHICKVDWAVGYAVSLRSCSESGSTSQRNLSAQWNVAVGIKGSPVSWDEVYTMHVNAAGSIWQ